MGVIFRARTGGVEFLCNHKNSGASTMAFAPSGISARVSGLKTSAWVICNTKYRSESDTLNTDMKNLRGVCAAGWGEPCPALRDATERSTNRGNALGRGESSPQLEMGTAHLPGIWAVPIPRTGARSPSGNSRGGCRGCIPLDQTQWYDERRHRLSFVFCLYSFCAVSSLKKPDRAPSPIPNLKIFPPN